MARPKKTLADLPSNWKKLILDIKRDGGSDVEVRVALDISTDLWDRFKKEIDEFSETVKKGQDLCEAWWLSHGAKQLENRSFNAVLWYMNMKNRFGWKDKAETDITSGGKPIPLLSALNVSHNNSDPKDSSPQKAD